MPWKDFVASQVLTSAELDTYFMNQVVIVCTSGTRPASPIEGMTVYETDTDLLAIYTGTAWQPVAATGAWTTYTPTLTQSGAVTKTVTYGRWIRHGRHITAAGFLDVTGAGTAAAAVIVGLPVAAATSLLTTVGVGHVFDTSAGARHGGLAFLDSASTIQFIPSAGSSGVLGTAVFTAALAAGDQIGFSVTYEAAA